MTGQISEALISTLRGKKSIAAWLASRPTDEVDAFLQSLADNTATSLPWLFEAWGRPDTQLEPEGLWRTWVILGGRGSGKTRAGAEWVRRQVEGARPSDAGTASRIALVGQTFDEAREVMVFGESGILACSPPDRRPRYNGSRRMLEWSNGASAQLFSASSPEGLRGPQFDGAWLDEVGKWPSGREAWDMLQFGLRLGKTPRQVVTTTPSPSRLLLDIAAEDGTVVVAAPTEANAGNLSDGFVDQIRRAYGGTRLERQELLGEFVLDHPGALWTRDLLEAAKVDRAPELDRVVVAVDPPVTSGENADECGIVVAGVAGEGAGRTAYVISDCSIAGATPQAWATRAAEAFHIHQADRIVAEVNQGGEMVEQTLRYVDPLIPYQGVRASRSKKARAEPISALYEQGRVKHLRGFDRLEDQMCEFGSAGARGSPDRVDALVWALTQLMLNPTGAPRARRL